MVFVARWDLDKTYLRTEFDTVRDLLRTAFESAEQKRTVPGAASLLRELGACGARVHILSGSPKQMRGKLEEKLRLDGVRFESLTLKPNLENLLKLRLRAVRDQLGYKLPALLKSRATMEDPRDAVGLIPEVLLGDDAEADALVYSLYADVCAGVVDDSILGDAMRAGRVYDDLVADALRWARLIEKGNFVRRILIHLERQSAPARFEDFGHRVVPFYNYLQAALVLLKDGFVTPAGVIRVAVELVLEHRFDAEALARSYLELYRRRILDRSLANTLMEAAAKLAQEAVFPAVDEVIGMGRLLHEALDEHASEGVFTDVSSLKASNYVQLVHKHATRRSRWGGLLDT